MVNTIFTLISAVDGDVFYLYLYVLSIVYLHLFKWYEQTTRVGAPAKRRKLKSDYKSYANIKLNVPKLNIALACHFRLAGFARQRWASLQCCRSNPPNKV